MVRQHGFANAAALDQNKQAWRPMVAWLHQYLSSTNR
jgi:hypothetical protein